MDDLDQRATNTIRIMIAATACLGMLVVLGGIGVMMMKGTISAELFGSWKSGTGLAVVFLFFIAIFRRVLGGPKGKELKRSEP